MIILENMQKIKIEQRDVGMLGEMENQVPHIIIRLSTGAVLARRITIKQISDRGWQEHQPSDEELLGELQGYNYIKEERESVDKAILEERNFLGKIKELLSRRKWK